MAHAPITAAMGSALLLASILTIADVTAPIPNCNAPISADAVPAFLLKGAIDNAEELGNVKPCVLKNTHIKKIIEYRCSRLKYAPINSAIPVILWQSNAIRII